VQSGRSSASICLRMILHHGRYVGGSTQPHIHEIKLVSFARYREIWTELSHCYNPGTSEYRKELIPLGRNSARLRETDCTVLDNHKRQYILADSRRRSNNSTEGRIILFVCAEATVLAPLSHFSPATVEFNESRLDSDVYKIVSRFAL